MQDKIAAYYQLTKPGVLYGNVLTGVAGFFLASAGDVDWARFVGMLVGLTAVIAAACVLNNFLDRDIDAVMERTKGRPSVTGAVSEVGMTVFWLALFVIGSAILYIFTNVLTMWVGIAGFVVYVWLYGAFSKRRSIYGTAVGSVSGALPIVGGYTAVTNELDAGAFVLFAIMFFWQFPEFFSIAIYRRKEYAAANVPVMSVVKGVQSTVSQIFLATILYAASTLLLTLTGYTGVIYLVVMLIAGVYWVVLAYEGLRARRPEEWARKMFKTAMWQILLLCVMLVVGPLLP